MAFHNRAKVATATIGQGTLTLGASASGFCTFAEAGVANAETVSYVIEEGNDFEVGTGVYTTAGTTLTRATVLLSKIAGVSGTTKMTLAGAAVVYVTAAAEDLIPPLSPSNDDIIQRKAGAWTNRTMTQLIADLAALATAFQPLDADLTSIAALTTTSFGRSVLATASASTLRTLAGSVIGTNVQAYSAALDRAALAMTEQAVSSSTTLSIDLNSGWHVALALGGNVTSVAFTNVPTTGLLAKVTLEITSSGSFTMTGWPGTTRWAAGAAPTITASGRDTIILTTIDGGTTWRGYVAAQAMA